MVLVSGAIQLGWGWLRLRSYLVLVSQSNFIFDAHLTVEFQRFGVNLTVEFQQIHFSILVKHLFVNVSSDLSMSCKALILLVGSRLLVGSSGCPPDAA